MQMYAGTHRFDSFVVDAHCQAQLRIAAHSHTVPLCGSKPTQLSLAGLFISEWTARLLITFTTTLYHHKYMQPSGMYMPYKTFSLLMVLLSLTQVRFASAKGTQTGSKLAALSHVTHISHSPSIWVFCGYSLRSSSPAQWTFEAIHTASGIKGGGVPRAQWRTPVPAREPAMIKVYAAGVE